MLFLTALLFIISSSSHGLIKLHKNEILTRSALFGVRNSNNFLLFLNTIFQDSTFIGVGGLFALLLNRISLDAVSDIQSRSDIIGVMSCSAILLNAISERNIEANSRQPVALFGYSIKSPVFIPDLESNEKSCINWIMEALLETQAVTSVCVVKDCEIIGAVGVVATSNILQKIKIENKPILNRVLEKSEEVYLPDLQVI